MAITPQDVVGWFGSLPEAARHLSLLTALYLSCWAYTLRLDAFLIDDEEGIRRFSDRYDSERQIVLDAYEHEEGGKKTVYKNSQFNPQLPFPVSVLRWLRILWGRKFREIGKNRAGHPVYGYVQSAPKHHVLSLLIHYANSVLAYFLLSGLFGGNLAFAATALFIAHPITVQAVAWISGIGYLLSLFFALLAFHVAGISEPYGVYGSAIATYLSCTSLLSGFANWVILTYMGNYHSAAISLLVGAFVMFTYGRSTVQYRKDAFRAQNLGRSTTLNLRKPIVIVKTMFYYLKMLIFPKRLGLFHKWGYHFEEGLERVDGMFWSGMAVIAMSLISFYYGPEPVRFGILWLFSYLILFSNVITAQQFVADRYAFISSLGFCLILANLLAPYPMALCLLLGVYIMRVWVHLPTFSGHEAFYRSNISNFPDSEVAYGNLGVIYSQNGMGGSAADVWNKALSINQHYDVPAYNLYSLFRSNGMFTQAREYLVKALNAKTVHFKEQWERELVDLEKHIASKAAVDDLNAKLNEAVRLGNKDDIIKLRDEIIRITTPQSPS